MSNFDDNVVIISFHNETILLVQEDAIGFSELLEIATKQDLEDLITVEGFFNLIIFN